MPDTWKLGGYPRYADIIGGFETEAPTVESVKVPTTREDVSVWRFVQRLKEDMKSSKNLFSQNWDYYYALFVGRQWITPGKAGRTIREGNRPWYKSTLVVNYIFPTIDMELATIFDNNPKPFLSATSPTQTEYVSAMQAGVDLIWNDENLQDKLEMATQDAAIYGTAIMKAVWDPSADKGAGRIRWYNVAIENFFVDRAAVSLHDGEYTAIMELSQVPLSVIRRMFPEKASRISMDLGAIPHQERKELGGYGGMGYDIPTSILSPGNAAGFYQSNEAPFTPAMGCEDYMIEVVELWIEDHSQKEILEQYPVGVGPTGMPIMASKTRLVDAFPNGRLITAAGGVVLQDGPSPYKRPPYVVVRHITMTKRFWGIGIPELVGDQQLEINKRRSHLMDSVNSMGNPLWVVDLEADIPPDMDLNEPGCVVTKRSQYGVQRLSPVEMPRWILEMGHLPIGDIYTITGAGGAMSNPATGKRSGTAVAEAASSANIRIRRRAMQVDIAIKDITRINIEMIQKFWSTPRWVQVMGSWGKPTPVPFDMRHARGQWDINVESGSAAASSKIARRQEAIALFNMRVIGPMHLLEAMDWPNRDQVAKDMGFYQDGGIYAYAGYPGFPDSRAPSADGYAMQTRYTNPPPPQAMMPPGVEGGGGVGGNVQTAGPAKLGTAAPSNAMRGFPYGKPTGIRA